VSVVCPCKPLEISLTDLISGGPATASFGAPLSWSETPQTARPDGHEMSFVEAITGVSENMFLTILLPDILFRLPFKKWAPQASFETI